MSRGVMAVLGVALGLALLMILAFLVFHSLGLTDETWIRSNLVEISAGGSGGVYLAAGTIYLLLILDLVLPIPSNILMILAGFLCGPFLGGTVGFLGSMTSAIIGFLICRRFGRGAFKRLAGSSDNQTTEQFLDRHGKWAVFLSRPIPLVAEVTSCMAGLSRMSLKSFLLYATLGSLPLAVLYATAGAQAEENPQLGWLVLIAIFVPAAALLAMWTGKNKG